jgi:hypothetical protein
MRILAGQNGEVRRSPAQQIERLSAIGAAVLEAHDVAVTGQPQHGLIAEIDGGPVRNVVEQDGLCNALRERREVKFKAALRGPRIRGTGDQISVDRPGRGAGKRARQSRGVAASQAETERKRVAAEFVPGRGYQPSVSWGSSVRPSPVVAARTSPLTGRET